MLALSGSGNNAFAGNAITIGIGLPPGSTGIELGIFDGETGGNWDQGTTALEYNLYTDKNGDGSELNLVASFTGGQMTNNAWWSTTIPQDSRSLASNGNYVYMLEVTMPAGVGHTSAFKIRTNGTITVKAHQSFSISAPLTNFSDGAIIYPDFNATDLMNPANYYRRNYDGIWNIYLDVPQPSTALKIWDGDMDHGSALDASIVDTDDQNTPNEKPGWATENARPEGDVNTDALLAANPPDDNSAPYNRHSPSVRYEVIFPDGVTKYENNNPSGNLEWEQFRIDTQSSDPTVTDATATEIPAGIYTVRLVGMDMLNVNAWRFFNDVQGVPANNNEVIGVNEEGQPIAPLRAVETVSGAIGGTIYYDANEDLTQNAGEPGLPTVTVRCHRLNSDGSVASTKTSMTDVDGRYTFSALPAGTYRIAVDGSTLQSDVLPTVDLDGIETVHSAVAEVSANASTRTASFGYKRGFVVSTGTRGYWTNHPTAWPTSQIVVGGVLYTSVAEAITKIFRVATRGDKCYSLAAQLLATKLNLLSGSQSDCIAEDVQTAELWLAQHPVGAGRTSDEVWATISAVHDRLDDYNNGELCAPHMD